MTKQKTTKKTLLTSVLSLVLCMAMLVGTTFAWFTDNVTSKNNIIKSGTLDVTMEWADGTKAVPADDSADWKDASAGAIFDYDLWEPGYTEVRHIKIANEGTLALKYQLNIVANGDVSKLADVIDVYYLDPADMVDERADLVAEKRIGTLTEVLSAISTTASGNLLAGENHTITLALKMQESAGNEYQNLSIGSDFSVQLMATQLTSENDSFDNQYDRMATIDDIDELNEALAADYDLIQLGANITVTESIVIPAGKTVAIDLAGYTMSQEKGDITAAYALIDNKGTLTIEDSVGTGKISFADTTPYTADIGWASNTIRNTGVLTVNGGTVENVTAEAVMKFSYPHAIDCYQGSVTTINGGTVKSLNYDSIRMFCNSETLATTVTINGGTIINRVSFQDPSAQKAGYGVLNINGGNFVTTAGVNANVRLLNFSKVCSNMKATVTGGTFDKGFKTQDLASCGVVTADWLTYAGATAVASDADSLQKAIDNAENGAVIKLVADIKGNVTVAQKENVKITIDGNKNTFAGSISIDGKSATILSAGVTIKNVNFDASAINTDACINMGIKGDNNTRYVTNLNVEDCTFTGTYPSAEQVGIKTYTGGGQNLSVKRCDATNMHSLAQIHNIVNVEFEDCDIVACKNGIGVGSSRNVKITGCDMNVDAYGVRGNGEESDAALTITDCNFTAHIPVVIRKVSKGYSVTVNGINKMTETNSEGLWCVAASNEYGDVDKAGLTAVTASVTISINDATLDKDGVFIKK